MPTADQLRGLAAYRAARADLAGAESALLEAMTQIDETRREIERAILAHDDAAVVALEGALARAEALREKSETARAQAIAAMAAGRALALGTAAAFDLLSSSQPLLLLPVRLETRFAWFDAAGGRSFSPSPGATRSLLIRVYPDDVHDDAHPPELTRDEFELITRLKWQLSQARDLVHLDDAWSDLMRRVGPTRAAWLGELLARGGPAGRRPGSLSRPSVARLLPDRWTAFVELDDGSTRVAQSQQVFEPLETGPSPDGMKWMVDFGAALKAGMALVVPALPDPPVEVRRIVVVGARGTLDPDETAAELERLLDAQHYTRGCAFVAPGTPTNSLPGTRAGFSARPAPADLLPVERRRFLIGMRPSPLCSPHDETDASQLATALGIRAETFAYVPRADATDREAGRLMRRLLASAISRNLTRLLSGILDEAQVANGLGYGVEFVSALGPLPALRVGSQPYGVLPVLVRDNARLAPGTFAASALPVLDALRQRWEQAAAGLPRVGEPGSDAGQTLIRILQRDAVAQRIALRPLAGPQLAREVVARLRSRGSLDAQRAAAAQAIDDLGAVNSLASPLLEVLHLDFAPPLTVPLVEPVDVAAASPQRAANYLELVASLQPDRLLRHDYASAERPRSLLFAIARLALLERADAVAREVHIAAGADPAAWDDEDVTAAAHDPLATPLQRLEAVDPVDGAASVAFELSEQGDRAWDLGSIRGDLRLLATRPASETEVQLRAGLGLFSHRLDPWYTAFAVERLRELRHDPATASGLNVGAYGVVEALRASPRQPVPGARGLYTSPINGGYIHAPSAGHGAAAAVLRSVHLAHAAAGHGGTPGRGDAFSVDLSSARVRKGLHLLEGIRTGQPLAALLGYHIERALAAEGLQPLIAPLRRAAPIAAHALTPGTGPAESVAATNVIDGLTLLDEAGYDGATLPTVAALLARQPAIGALSRPDAAVLEGVLRSAVDALDAVADLAVAESVFQSVQGNAVRAGGAVDGLSGAPVPPPEIGVVRSPRTGVGVTHRLLVLLEAGPRHATAWAATPRALAEPRLEAWAQAALPAPADIEIRARFVGADGAEVAALDWTLGTLFKRAIDAGAPELALGALDVVLVADPHETPHQSPLELRLEALVELQRPAHAAAATLELVYARGRGRGRDTFGLVEALEVARALREAITRARPLRPEDLATPGASAPAAVDEAELAGRATAAERALEAAIAALERLRDPRTRDTALIRRGLFAADLFGVAGAAPASRRDPPGAMAEPVGQRKRELQALLHQVDSVLAELRRRSDAVAKLPSGDAVGKLRAVFGAAFTVLPVLAPAEAVVAGFAGGTAPDGATPAAARTWLGRAAAIREGVGALDRVLGYADALSAVDATAPVPSLHVSQLGGAPGERWTALPAAPGGTIPGGRISLVAATPGAALPAAAPAGLFVDEWVEVVPGTHETTSVAFHCDAPIAAAPQVWLLGVPPPGLEAWTEDGARRIVEEALDLARLRLVDVDDVPDLGQLLPVFVTAENPHGEATGLDVEILTEPEA
jgi:hypothetical protein